GAGRALEIKSRLLSAADGCIARRAAVVREYAETEDAIGAESSDRVLFRAGARAGGGNLARGGASGGARQVVGGIAHDLHGYLGRRLAADLHVGKLHRSPGEAVREFRALDDGVASGSSLLLQSGGEGRAENGGHDAQSVRAGVDLDMV